MFYFCDVQKLNILYSIQLNVAFFGQKKVEMSVPPHALHFSNAVFTPQSFFPGPVHSLRVLVFLYPRFVSCSQRGMQSPVHCGARERGCMFLSPWASPGLQQQDVWGCGLLQSSPEVQPSVWAVQDHSEVLLLSRMDAWPRWRQLSQYR